MCILYFSYLLIISHAFDVLFRETTFIVITKKRSPPRFIVISQSLYRLLFQDDLILSEWGEVAGGEENGKYI